MQKTDFSVNCSKWIQRQEFWYVFLTVSYDFKWLAELKFNTGLIFFLTAFTELDFMSYNSFT